MRLWHYKYVHVLPTAQLLGLWKECLDISEKWAVEGYVKNALNDYIEVCPLVDWLYYMQIIYLTMVERGFKVDDFTKAKLIDLLYCVSLLDNVITDEICGGDMRENIRDSIFPPNENKIMDEDLDIVIFNGFHDNTYNQICYYALYERYLRGLIPETEWKAFNDEALKYA
jgi:hypothetical protein